MGEACGRPQRIVEAVVESNATRKRGLAQRVRRACGGSLEGRRVAVLGLAFKPDTDDVRESPALDLVPALLREGAEEVRVHDPCALEMAQAVLDGPALEGAGLAGVAGAAPVSCRHVRDCLEAVDVVSVLTPWRGYPLPRLPGCARP